VVHHGTNRLFDYFFDFQAYSILLKFFYAFSPVCENGSQVLRGRTVFLRPTSPSVLIFCTSLHTFKCSVFRIITFKPRLSSSSVIYDASSLPCAI